MSEKQQYLCAIARKYTSEHLMDVQLLEAYSPHDALDQCLIIRPDLSDLVNNSIAYLDWTIVDD